MEHPGQALFSSNWYRLAALKPRLRGHIRIHRHAYRSQIWYVIEDRIAGKYHRFNPASYKVISLMDGRRDMQAVWDRLTVELADDTPTQDEVISLLGQLHSADLIQCDVTPDVAELFERRGKQVRKKWISRFANPISLRFPLWDPDSFLVRLVRWFKPLWGWWGVGLWLAVVLPALFLVPSHWPDLTENFSERLLTMDNLLIMAVVFPLVKALHELGHGVACKIRGGEVHEMGIMLLVFFPIPYVDASSSSAFVNKWQRMLVGAAGMLTEIFIAALAFYVWTLLEPGIARSLAYNVVILASVTTLFFNANPLLRYDGYYVLADWIESPNLGSRANKHWQYLAERYLFKVKKAEPPPATPGERRWFVGYAPLAFFYRMFVLFSIALFVAQQYLIVGVLIALWGLISSLGMPIYKGIKAILTGPQYADRGPRVRAVLAGILVGLLVLFFVLPVPYHTTAEGVLWPPEKAILRAEANGFVDKLLAGPGDELAPGQPVLAGYNPVLLAQLQAQAAKVEELQAQYDAAWGVSPARASQLLEELRREQATQARLEDENERLTLRSGLAGRLLVQNPDDLPGRLLKKGEVVGYVQTDYVPLVRVVVPQADVDLVRLATRAVEIKLPQDLDTTWPAQVMREVPAAGKNLPSPALGMQGGGNIPLDPRDEQGTQALQSLFEFELRLPKDVPHHYLGSRVHVRFEHPPEPIGLRLGRALRRLFLSHFQV